MQGSEAKLTTSREKETELIAQMKASTELQMQTVEKIRQESAADQEQFFKMMQSIFDKLGPLSLTKGKIPSIAKEAS